MSGASGGIALLCGMICVVLAVTGEPQTAFGGQEARRARSSDGVDIAYSVTGVDGPTVVLVHGLFCDRSYWRNQIDVLGRDHRVVALDLAGHGESGANRETWSLEAFGDDVVAVVDAVEAESVVLIGHSMGGPVSIEAAAVLGPRVRAVIGVDTFHDFQPAMSPDRLHEFLEPFRNDFASMTARFVGGWMFEPGTEGEMKDEIVRDMASTPPEIGVAALEAYFRWDAERARRAFAAVSAAQASINGDLISVNQDTTADVAPRLRFQTLTGAGHFLSSSTPSASTSSS